MNDKPNYKKGVRLEIVKLMHVYGLIPCRTLMAFENAETFQKKMNQMEKEGVVIRKRANGHNRRILNFFSFNNYPEFAPTITKNLPVEYRNSYKGDSEKEVWKAMDTSEGQNYRPITNANIGILMYGAGVKVMPDEKPDLKKDGSFDDNDSYYYTSKDIKRYTGYKDDVKFESKDTTSNKIKKVIGSRLIGLLISPGDIYAVYGIPNKSMQWHSGGEIKMKAHLNNLLAHKLAVPQSVENALMLITRYADFSGIVNPRTEKERDAAYFFDGLLEIFTNIYCLPDDISGRKMLEIMKKKYWREIMRQEFLQGFTQGTYSNGVACDAYDDTKHILMMMDPEIHKMKYYLSAAQKSQAEGNPKDRFFVMCFDYQKELAVRIFGKYCKIAMTSFDRYYRKIIENES